MKMLRRIFEALKTTETCSVVLTCLCILSTLVLPMSAYADVGVTINGPAGNKSQTIAGDSGSFDMNVPLAKNAVNKLTVTAKDANGNMASRDINVTQVSFDSLVVAKVKAEPLPVERIEQLVNDGVINISDPANFNVSQFTIVLTIAQEPVRIDIPVVVPKLDIPLGTEVYAIPQGDGGGGRPKDQPPVTVIVFQMTPPGPPGFDPPSIPGIIVIDGRIKTLKEFYSVKFLMMNTSGIFTLKDVSASLEFPNGGLTNILPADGMGALGDILPGSGDLPGQAQKEFIIRGDEIGTRGIKVSFGGKVGGAGIPDGDEIPFNGSADTSVEVKGPPSFNVRVTHPDAVVAGVPYDLGIDITNTGETPALYASLDLDVGFDTKLQKCSVTGAADPVCEDIDGPETRSFGHILPGQTVREVFHLKPSKSGPISSCMGISDQNINLQVSVGNLGCITGQFPPGRNSPDGIPTVAVLPPNNAQGVALDAPVLLIFDKLMSQGTINTGDGGSVNVYDRAGVLQPGSMRFDTLNGDTFAVWQFEDGITNRLTPDTEYTIEIKRTIRDTQGNQLRNEFTGKFTTTGEGIDDFTPPTITLGVEPPVNVNNVIPGQMIKVSAYPSDQGSGVQRVELRIKDLDVADSQYQLVDQRKFVLGDKFPYFFSIDSKKLIAGHTYQLKGTAFDGVGNPGDTTLALAISLVAPVPTISLPTIDPTLRGKLVSITPMSITGGAYKVDYVLDDQATVYQSVTVAPYQVTVPTKDLTVGIHTLKAVALDGLNQAGEAQLSFEVLENNSPPTIVFATPTPSQDVITGSVLSVNAQIDDVTGVTSIKWYFDNPNGAPFAQNTKSFGLNTTGIPLGDHTLYVVATNNIGLSTSTANADTFRLIHIINPPPEPAPPPPSFTDVSAPASGKVSFTGTTAANRRVDVTNPAFPGLVLSLTSNGGGNFSGEIDGDVGDTINAKAFNAAQDLFSANGSTVVPPPVSVLSISANPTTLSFTNAFNEFQDLTITAQKSDASNQNVTTLASYQSSNPAAVAVNGVGRVVAIGNGSAVITATYAGKTATVNVTVNVFALTSISVSPNPLNFSSVGQTQQLSVTGTYTDSSAQPLPSGTVFTTGNPSIASVNASGLVTASGSGSTTITASRAGVAPVAVPVSVSIVDNSNPIASITSPADHTDVERGQNVSISVQATDVGTGVIKLHLSTSGQATVTDLKQIPATTNTNQSFNFIVPNAATIGGTITVNVTAEDAVGNLSSVASITLDVVDATGPAVSIISPTQQQGYNFGDTVSITVNATDSVGVTQIRYTAEGGVTFNGSQSFPATPGQRSATFSFIVPFGVVNPDVRIRGYAKDAANNEMQAAPVDVVITSADVTAPETQATGVSSPGSGTTTNISFAVTDGLSDLDYVVLFYRRNGIGTFNRYTDALGGNPEGKFHPSSGNTGTIAFDSTRMGGDGNYEFYTVGYDLAGNREADPLSGAVITPDQTTTFNSGTPVTVINTNTAISNANFGFDNQNLRLTGNIVVTIDGVHTFKNVELLNGAKVVHTDATPSTEPGLTLNLWSLTIDSTSSIDLTGLGYRGGLNSGNGNSFGLTLGNAPGASFRSAGSYGGLGGAVEGTPNTIYGSLADPKELGSGGSYGSAGGGSPGGNGGGRVAITGINVANDGVIASDGQNSPAGFQAGNGSGGAIKISSATVSGSGVIRANGNAVSGGQNEVGGGGGRVAILFTDVSTLDRTKVRALGGTGNSRIGTNGTVFFSGLGETNGTLIVDGQGANTPFTPLAIPNGFTFDNIIVRNNARVTIDTPVSITGTFSVLENSVVTHSIESADGLVINADKIIVDSTSAIDVTGRGYRGGLNSGNGNSFGLSIPGSAGASYRSGGSYGGIGGVRDGSGSNLPYGDPKNPIYLGSGGSYGSAGGGSPGGNGGGRITLNAAASIQVDGGIRADGQNGTGFEGGNGSGGSVKIATSNLKGTGFISANGQAVSGGQNEVGGGGGRIAISYDFLGVSGNDLNDTLNITAYGGKSSSRRGSAGTVYLKRSDQVDGVLYLDENMPSGQTSSVVAPVGTQIGFGRVLSVTTDTLVVDSNPGTSTFGVVPFAPNGLVGLTIQPNSLIDQRYTILSNTASSITVDTTGKPPLTAIAATGAIYHGVYQFDDVVLRRGTFAMLGDKLFVNNKLLVAENSFLSHYDVTTTFNSRLEVDADTVQIDAGSRIDVSGRGYRGGSRNGYNSPNGETVGGQAGSPYRSAGSYGGLGGVREGSGANPIYGSVTDPLDLGSGGSYGSAGAGSAGGNGGGRIQIVASELIVDGELASNGLNSLAGFEAGNGSGGSVNLNIGTLSGSGFIRANGSAPFFGGQNEVGGGGGRIAIRYNALSFDQSHIEILGGIGVSRIGGNGTLFLKGPGQSLGDLIIDGQGTNTPDDLTTLISVGGLDNIIFRNNARVVLTFPLVANNSIQLLNGSRITHPIADEDGAQIFANSLLIDATSIIDATGRGYRGGFRNGYNNSNGETLGGQPGAVYRSGGSYGGAGGVREGTGSNPIYGTPEDPIYLGSGGSFGAAGAGSPGGNGGGRIDISLTGNLVVQGEIRADGQTGTGFESGNGSGGSVKISAANISGTGKISANGLALSGGSSEVGGGGGRIALFYDSFGGVNGNFNNTLDVTAFAGFAVSRVGSAGTVYLKDKAASKGDLIFDAGLASGTSGLASSFTRIGFGNVSGVTSEAITLDGTRRVLAGGLVGLKIKPTLSAASQFSIVSNTDSEVTVDNQGTDLTSFVFFGDQYSAVHNFRNVTLRRGAQLELDDILQVDQTLLVSDRSLITHAGSTLASTSRLEVQAGTLTLDATSSIDTTGRGYLGGSRGDNGSCNARTFGNASGSTFRSAGSYAGLGGTLGGTPNPVYGSSTAPAALGSGGSCGSAGGGSPGGNGGGWISGVFGVANIDGAIIADGQNSGSGFGAGNGSGGTVNLTIGTMNGSGAIRANGFSPTGGQNEVGGGGGRVRIQRTTNNYTGAITALGGSGNTAVGANGSVSVVP